jgi:hypothetical protein
VREDFTLTEAVAIKKAIESMLAAEAKARQIAAGVEGKKKWTRENPRQGRRAHRQGR